MLQENKRPGPEPFGSILGYAPGGVPSYSSDYDSANEQEFTDRHSYRSFVDGIYMGMKWQCVEFARRWLYANLGWVFDDVAMAYDIFRLQSGLVISDGSRLPLHSFRNGSRRRPEPGAMLIWNEGGHFTTTGHVAIITDVGDGSVRIAEQNFEHRKWQDDRRWSRELAMTVSESGEIHIDGGGDNAEILGWVIQTTDDSHAERFAPADPTLMNLELREIAAEVKKSDTWLDPARAEDAAYIAAEGHALATDATDLRKYLRISESALAELKRATTELHALFLVATEHVLRNDALLEKFNLPKALWPRIRESWNRRRSELISGRFDFALSEKGLKVYEYNCDSCGCHMEAGRLQGLWADRYDCTDGYDAGRLLAERLTQAWRKADVDGVIHIMHDRDSEETYHALYMKRIIEAAGLQAVVLRGLKGLDWGADGAVVDPDGQPIRWVWKTWAWETALDQIRGECEDDDEALREGRPPAAGDHAPRLVDVLLRKSVMVYEPLWTLVPSNKAILPVLWRLCPNHPWLLRSAFELRSELEETGYAVKPIVGRGGANISLVNRRHDLVEETAGKFEDRDQVYQELWRLPNIDGLNVQVCTFSAGGAYAGSCVRVDRSLVINMDSDCLPLRVVPDSRMAGK
ncbi:MAG: glutathionylspermidine synthase family protein [Gammaproteobacteria bacterium]|nr:glutathionylspermidine synthase family protein [Gammaproteobacteria bacterium]